MLYQLNYIHHVWDCKDTEKIFTSKISKRFSSVRFVVRTLAVVVDDRFQDVVPR